MAEPSTVAALSPAEPDVRSLRKRTFGEFTPRERHQARRLTMVLLVVAGFFVVETIGAFFADSDVLKADALHLLMDVFALATALVAMRVAVRHPTARFTFGLRRAEPVAAIFNALLVLGATVGIVMEGIEDLRHGGSPKADLMLYVAIGALVVNGISVWLIHGAIETAHHAHDHERAHDHPDDPDRDHDHDHDRDLDWTESSVAGRSPGEATSPRKRSFRERSDHGHDHDHGHGHHGHSHSLNLRGAWLHLFGDALGSVAAIVAAIVIRLGFSPKADPIASFVVAVILVVGAVRLLREALLVLLEAAPPHLAVSRVRAAVAGTQGVAEVHDLHVWTLGAGHDAITVHVRTRAVDPALGRRVEKTIRDQFGVEYVTVQVETGGDDCAAPSAHDGHAH